MVEVPSLFINNSILDMIFSFYEVFIAKEYNMMDFEQSENSVLYSDVYTSVCACVCFGVDIISRDIPSQTTNARTGNCACSFKVYRMVGRNCKSYRMEQKYCKTYWIVQKYWESRISHTPSRSVYGVKKLQNLCPQYPT